MKTTKNAVNIKAEISHGDYSETLYASASTIKKALSRLIFESKNNYLPNAETAGFAEVAAGLERGERTGRGWVWFDIVTPQRSTLANVKPVCNADLSEPTMSTRDQLAEMGYKTNSEDWPAAGFCIALKNGKRHTAGDIITDLLTTRGELLAALENAVNLTLDDNDVCHQAFLKQSRAAIADAREHKAQGGK